MNFNKIMIFIDGSNLFKGSKRKGFRFSYEKLLDILKTDRNIVRMYYYSGRKVPNTTKQKKYFKMLKKLGIEVITTPLKRREIECGNCNHKEWIDIEKGVDASLSTDLLWYALQNAYDKAILLSGDADFLPAVKRVRLLGKSVELWTFKNSLAPELKAEADSCIIIDDYIDQIKKE